MPGRTKARAAIVCSEFNEEITSRMFSRATERCRENGMAVTATCIVPGAFDIPLFLDLLLSRRDVDCAITLGAIVKGDTDHDSVIAREVASSVVGLSLKHGKPVALGISGPGMTWKQASDRAEEYAVRAADAAMKMTLTLRKMRRARRRNAE
ncbi:MAG: 6,7-dimethyl-8-ribityllumazine synthase [Thermoplasmata archaeon]|uniref:6,7-dimethyl-8-ribityllumazine synthase n=1 Tax=Candidatus Sysuiplasma superficiale TaxID=2823368 RepID=A0A8J7YPM5_9ARCH|nr:6,7-dimethyl-8-ribityllumazine synthase [Candidatus Sysuiplasma superficiale]